MTTTTVEITPPRLAAFGPPVWTHQRVRLMGERTISGIVATVVGTLVMAIPVSVGYVVGNEMGIPDESTAYQSSIADQAPPPSTINSGSTTVSFSPPDGAPVLRR